MKSNLKITQEVSFCKPNYKEQSFVEGRGIITAMYLNHEGRVMVDVAERTVLELPELVELPDDATPEVEIVNHTLSIKGINLNEDDLESYKSAVTKYAMEDDRLRNSERESDEKFHDSIWTKEVLARVETHKAESEARIKQFNKDLNVLNSAAFGEPVIDIESIKAK